MRNSAVSKFWGLEKDGMRVECVGLMSVVISGTVLLVEDLVRATGGMVEVSVVGEDRATGVSVSLIPDVVGTVEILSVE